MGDIVLFGGMAYDSYPFDLGDTWIWDGTTWTRASPATSPPGRYGASMAYDSATRTLVLFGGLGGSGEGVCGSCWLDDTWTWDGTTWRKASPATSPPARSGASMAYDAASGQVVLFGGSDYGGDVFGDTWTWDGTTWSEVSVGNTWKNQNHTLVHTSSTSGPPARSGASMAYDSASAQVVLFGGGGPVSGGGSCPLGDTWTWDRATWTQVSSGGTSTWGGNNCSYAGPPSVPSARGGASMVYDPVTSNMVLFGGGGTGGWFCPLGDTWTWDGTTWTQASPATSPPAREGASMAYDSATKSVMLFGGSGSSRSCTGTNISDRAPEAAVSQGGAGAGIAEPPALDDTWAWDGSTWTQT